MANQSQRTNRRKTPGAGALFWLSVVTLGIYAIVYTARRWQENFDEMADLREDLAGLRETVTRIECAARGRHDREGLTSGSARCRFAST